MADKYLLRVTAGSSNDTTTHRIVQVNEPTPTKVSTPVCDAQISVRIQNYRGLPREAPNTSPYFSHPSHLHDQYSIAFTLLPRKSIPGTALLFGNTFDRPIRDRLPPGTGTAFRIAKWAVDPGMDGDLYSDTPYIYGNALSSVNVLRVGEKAVEDGAGPPDPAGETSPLEEGADGDGGEWRRRRDVPETSDARKKHFLTKGRTEGWEWERGRVYECDFFNPYLDFNSFSLKLPGFSLSLLPYLGGTDYLRYVLKIKDTDEILFVLVFSLLKKEDVETQEASVGEEEGEGVKVTSSGTDGARHEGEESFEPEQADLD